MSTDHYTYRVTWSAEDAEHVGLCTEFPSGTSHLIYKPPWPGDPRMNIQNASGQAKAYQVR